MVIKSGLEEYIKHRYQASELIQETQNPLILTIFTNQGRRYIEMRHILENNLDGCPLFAVMRQTITMLLESVVDDHELALVPHPIMASGILILRSYATHLLERFLPFE